MNEEKTPEKEKNTGMAAVAYILFFVPLLTEAKNDPFVKYHIKQGLIVFITWLAIGIISPVLIFIPILGWIAMRLLYLFVVILMIIGIINAVGGKQTPLPIIGKYADKFKF